MNDRLRWALVLVLVAGFVSLFCLYNFRGDESTGVLVLHPLKDVQPAPIRTIAQQALTAKVTGEETLADHVWSMCQKKKKKTEMPSRPQAYSHILVDDKHKALYCYVPKVACSNWRRVLLVMLGKVSQKHMFVIHPHSPPYTHKIPVLNQFSASAIQHRLDTYYKFMFVRNPFERLLSAWRNKFQSNLTSSVKFRRRIAKTILTRYRSCLKGEGSKKAQQSDDQIVRFDEFLHYIVDRKDAKRKLNEHWESFHRLCYPCAVHYDFVGKYESLATEAEHVLKVLNATHLVHFPARSVSYRHRKTLFYVAQFYTNISDSLLRRVYQSFYTDFYLFNYTIPEFLQPKLGL